MKAKKFLVSATAFMTALLSAVLFVGCQKKEPAQADYPYYANSQEIYDASDVIIIGKVTTAGSVRNLNVYEDSGKTEKYTVSSVEILQVIKGDVNVGDVIEVKQLGDKEHPETELAEIDGYFKEGTEQLLFLAAFESTPYSTVNPAQGAVEVRDGKLYSASKYSLFGFAEGNAEHMSVESVTDELMGFSK